MADEYPWTVRSALWFVNSVDGVVAAVLGSAKAVGDRRDHAPHKPPLAGLRRATSMGAKGAKWSVVGVIGLGALLMVGAMIFLPKAKPTLSASVKAPIASVPAVSLAARSKAGADLIARRCRAGAYRSLPEIEQAECAGRPSQSPAITGDRK
jgi:hypothetical protein